MVLVLVKTAWVCDDAYITFRAVDNLVGGLGPRWNPDERVQAFTHPLWFLLLSACRLGGFDLYLASIVVAIALTLVTVFLVTAVLASGLVTAAAGVGALLGSKAFIDFSTSGLENPLTHALLAGFFVVHAGIQARPTGRRLTALTALAALLLVNRLDAGVLVLPALLWTSWQYGPRAALVPLLLGSLPLVAWELFGIAYYGFPVPNTAYAKLATGISRSELWTQGAWYFRDSIARDPITLPLVGLAIAAPLHRRWRYDWPWLVGLLLAVAYVVHVGGEFMTGRFLTALAVVGTCQLVRYQVALNPRVWPLALALPVALAASGPASPVWSGRGFGQDPDATAPFHGIYDERAFYYPRTGLVTRWTAGPVPFPGVPSLVAAMKASGRTVVTRDAVGYFGYLMGPDMHVIDTFGLADPLLARLPAESPWRIGHFRRRLPPGYVQSLRAGENLIEDPGVAAFYDDIQLVTRGQLWTSNRWRAIVQLNLGLHDYLLDGYRRGYAGVRWSRIAGSAAAAGTEPSDSRILTFDTGVVVYLPRPTVVGAFALTLGARAAYRITVCRGSRDLMVTELETGGGPGAMYVQQVRLPGGSQSVDRIRIEALRGSRPFVVGSLEVTR